MNLKTPRPTYKGKKKFVKSAGVCAAVGMHEIQCGGVIDEAHVKFIASQNAVKDQIFPGANVKNDKYTVPLCRFHHDYQGTIPEKEFWIGKPIGALCEDIHDAYLEKNNESLFLSLALFSGVKCTEN